MGNILTSDELVESPTSKLQLDSSAPLATENASTVAVAEAQPPVKKLKSLKFFYIGLAWAFGYPTTAMLIGYAVSLSNGGGPAVA